MDTRIIKYSIVTYVLFVFIANDAMTEALRCYECGWSSKPAHCKERNKMKDADNLPYPVPKHCIASDNELSKEELDKEKCDKRRCQMNNPACLKWSFIAAGSVENITYTCVENPGNRKGKYELDSTTKDEKKKTQNTKTYKIEVFLCNDDYCNGAIRPLQSFMFLWTFVLLLCYSSWFINNR